MYTDDQTAIAGWVNPGSDQWEKRAAAVYLAAASTIRQRTDGVSTIIRNREFKMAARLALAGIASGQYVDAFRAARAAMQTGAPHLAINAIAALPGLGYPKAGFVLQMIWGVGGCIDTRNTKEFGLVADDIPVWRRQHTPAIRDHNARKYLALCERLGGSLYLWDNWCAGVALDHRQRATWNGNADDVSKAHVTWVHGCYNVLWG